MDQEARWIRHSKKDPGHRSANLLVQKYYKEMFGFIYKQTLDSDLSLDLTQEVFISVLRSLRHFDGKRASFRTWMYKIASNRLIDYYRSRAYKSRRREESLEVLGEPEDWLLASDENVEQELESLENSKEIAKAIADLDSVAQEVIRLKLYGEQTFKEIAEITDQPESTVKTKYYAALRRLRQKLQNMREDMYV